MMVTRATSFEGPKLGSIRGQEVLSPDLGQHDTEDLYSSTSRACRFGTLCRSYRRTRAVVETSY